MRIVLVDDHTLVRAGLRALLDDMPDHTVVAEASDGTAGLAAVLQFRPDLLITDLTMAGMNGFELTEKVVRDCPATRVIVLSMYSSKEHVLRAMSAGASAYLLKDAAESDLGQALAAVARGESYLSPAASRRMAELAEESGSEPDPLARLTARQREVLTLIAEGLGTKQIAHRLEISPKTVEVHRAELMARLDIHDIASLVRLALRVGLVSPGP